MKKKILIAPLNWGLGHATRCIPIITALLENNYTPVIASDGAALSLLTKEFPEVETLELPSYDITYSKKGCFLKFKLFKHSPKIIKAIRAEKKAIKNIVKTHQIDGIISDNRFGVFHKNVPSVFITHQLQVLSGMTTWLSTKLHHNIIKMFDECWVPDVSGYPNLSGKMGHLDTHQLNLKYIGPLSRFQNIPCEFQYAIMIILSGPEPQRSILEKKLFSEFKNYNGEVLFVKGIVEQEQKVEKVRNLTIYNFMTTSLLENSLNASRLVIARSGYTTLMDLAKLGKKAFFIPTPGQFEQVYLAKRMKENNFASFCKQDNFNLDQLDHLENFTGLKAIAYDVNFKDLFKLFESK